MSALPLFALILVGFYLLIVRPQRARAKAAVALKARLAPGVDVMTTTGLFGTITEVRDDSVLLEVAPGVTLRFLTAAVGRIVDAEEPDTSDEDGDEPTTDGTTTLSDPADGTGSDADARRTTAGE